jgi:hypothetical protein
MVFFNVKPFENTHVNKTKNNSSAQYNFNKTHFTWDTITK